MGNNARVARRKKRQLVFLKPKDPSDISAGYAPLGSLREFEEALAPFNTAPDGSEGSSMGTRFLYGPGVVVEVPTGADVITQALVTVLDDDFALPVLMRICKTHKWKLQDTESGQMFG